MGEKPYSTTKLVEKQGNKKKDMTLIDEDSVENIDTKLDSRNNWKFKFSRGQLQRESEVGIQNGVISLFDSQRVFLQLLWFAVKRHASWLLLLQLALYLLCGPQLISGRYILYIALLMAFLVLMQGAFYFYFFLQVKQMEMLWNKSKIQRLRKTADAWVDIKISDLKVGDLILLNYNTVCPADILILDTSETHFSEKILSTNERRISGTNHWTVKLSIRNLNPVTKGKNTPYDALKVIASKLDGYIEYEPPSDRVSEFSGIFKLNNDPKVGLISHKNMVFCGTKLLADWTIGIILYTGKNTKIMQMNKPEESFLKRLSKEAKVSEMGSRLNNFVLILSLVSLAMAVIAIMLNMMASFTTPERLGVLVFYSNNEQWIGQAREILFTIHKHLVLIPHPAYIAYKFVCFFAALSIEKKNLWNWIVRRFKSNSTVQKNPYTGRRGMRKRSTKQVRKAARRRGAKENTIGDQKEDSLSGSSSTVPIPGQRFRSLTENDQAKDFMQKTMEATSNVKIVNFEVLPDLGAITHVVFDKTDTLTQPSMRVCQIISSDRVYDIIDDDNFTALILDFFKNPDEFVPDDPSSQKNRESEDYSEKSQEYLKEILGEYVPDIQDESDVDFDWIQKPEYRLNEREGEMASLELERRDSARSELWKYKREPTKESRASKHSGESGVGGGSNRQILLEEISRSNMSMDMVQLEQDFKKHFQLKHDRDSSDSNDEEAALDENGYRRRPHRPLEIQNERVFNERNLVADLCNKRPHLEELMNYLFLYFEFEREVSKKKHPDRKEDVALKLILEKLEYKTTKISEAHRNEGSSGYYNIKFESKCGAQGESTIFGLNIFSNNRNKRSMIIEITGDTKEYILLVIGSSKKMSEVLSLTKREKITLKLVTAKQKQKGLNTIIMAKKTLKKEEVVNYIRSAGKISQSARDQIEDLEKLAIEMETDLNFIGAVGLRDNIKSEAGKLTDLLDNAGINFSILSGDKLDNCLTTMQKLNKAPINIENSASYFSIRFQEERKILQEMRRIFDSIYDLLQKESYQSILTVTKTNKEDSLMTNPIRLSKKKRSRLHTFSVGEEDRLDKWAAVSALKPEGYKRLTKVLVISGESICTIMKSKLLHSHLLALLSFTHSVIGYQFQPRHKMYFVDLLKEKGDVVMAVGDGFNDIGMLASANVGVQISNQNVPLIFGDIVIEELSDIPRLLLLSGRKLHANVMIGLILILSNFTYNYTFMTLCLNYLPHTTLDFGIFYWVCYNLCFVYVVIFVAYNEHYTEEFTQLYPAIYQEKAIYTATFPMTLVSFFSLAVAEGSYLFYLAYLFLSQDLNAQGLPISFDQVSLLFSLTALLNSTFKVWFFFSKRNIPSLVLRVLALLLCVVLGYWLYREKINLGMQDVRALASFAGSYYTLAYSLVPHLLTWLLVTWTKQHRFYRSTKMVEHYLRDDVPQRLATNATLLSFLYDETNPREIYVDLIGRMKRLFPDQSLIDSSARRIIEIDFYESSLGISRLTNAIEDPDEARKFDHEQQKATLKRQEVILLFGALLVGLAEWVFALSSKTYYLALALDSYTLYSVLLVGALLLIVKYRPQGFNTALIGLLSLFTGVMATLLFALQHRLILPLNSLQKLLTSTVVKIPFPMLALFAIATEAINWASLIRNRELPVNSGQGLTRMFWLREVSALFVILLFRLMRSRNADMLKKIDFLNKIRLNSEISRSMEKMSMLMPGFVIDRMTSFEISKNFVADDAGEIAIMFCDICEFDEVIKECHGAIIDILDDVFRNFDILNKKHGIQKIETVGKTYMSAGGLKFIESTLDPQLRQRHFVARTLDLAIDMMAFIDKFTYRAGKHLKVKVGINYGNCIFGVIGYHKPQFSLIGDTINTTSRVCTTGKSGTITLSQSAYQVFRSAEKNFKRSDGKVEKQKFIKSTVFMKGKGDVNVFTFQDKKMREEELNKKKKVTIVVTKPKEQLMTNFEEFEGESVVNNRLKMLKSENILDFGRPVVSPNSSLNNSSDEEPGMSRNSQRGSNSPQTRMKVDRLSAIIRERSESRSPTRNNIGKAEQLIMKLQQQLGQEEGESHPQVAELSLLKKQTLKEQEYSDTPSHLLRKSIVAQDPTDELELKLKKVLSEEVEEEEEDHPHPSEKSSSGFGSFAKESIKLIETIEKEGRTPPNDEFSRAQQAMFEGGMTPAFGVGKKILAHKRSLSVIEDNSEQEEAAVGNIGPSQLMRSSSLKEKGQDTLRSAGKILLPTNDPHQMESLQSFFDFKTQIRYSSEIMFLILMLMIDIILTNISYLADPIYRTGPTSTFRLFFYVEILALLLVIYSGVAQKSLLAFKFSILGMFLARLTLDQVEIFTRPSTESGPQQLTTRLSIRISALRSVIEGIFLLSSGLFQPLESILANAVYFVVIVVDYAFFQRESEHLLDVFVLLVYFTHNIWDEFTRRRLVFKCYYNLMVTKRRSIEYMEFVDRLLPKHVQRTISEGSKASESYQQLTVLFADICGFTAYSAGKGSRQVVEMLSRLFTEFDKECNRLNLFKLYTIGDCYVVMGFLDKRNRKSPSEEANDVVQLGISMINIIKNVRRLIKFDGLDMRIGIHTGNVYGGVIGTDLVRYDLYGFDVLIANKMESGGQEGRINVSERTKDLLEELETINYTFEENKRIWIEPLGKEIPSYFLNYSEEDRDGHALLK